MDDEGEIDKMDEMDEMLDLDEMDEMDEAEGRGETDEGTSIIPASTSIKTSSDEFMRY